MRRGGDGGPAVVTVLCAGVVDVGAVGGDKHVDPAHRAAEQHAVLAVAGVRGWRPGEPDLRDRHRPHAPLREDVGVRGAVA